MTDKPETPSDPRPNREPYYIKNECPDCKEELVLYDEFEDTEGPTWYDEWYCPNCEAGIILDVPAGVLENDS